MPYGRLWVNELLQGAMDRWCSGKQICHVKVTDLVMRFKPCPPELRSYLQVRYSCLPVAGTDQSCCEFSRNHAFIKAGYGYVASSLVQATGCGSDDCPWRIEAQIGQQINISLYDFSSANTGTSGEHVTKASNQTSRCEIYAILEELSIGTSQIICRGENRYQQIYTTSSHMVDLRITNSEHHDGNMFHFIIEYKAYGCPDPDAPPDGFVKRTGGHATVHCDYPGDEKWEITCMDGQWRGDVGNCSLVAPIEYGVIESGAQHHMDNIAPGIVIALIISSAIVIAVTTITIGIVCLKSYSRQQETVTLAFDARTSRKYSAKEDSFVPEEVLLPRNYTTSQRSERPWYLTRPLPKPYVVCDTENITDRPCDRMHTNLQDHVTKDVTYYELDPSGTIFTRDTSGRKAVNSTIKSRESERNF